MKYKTLLFIITAFFIVLSNQTKGQTSQEILEAYKQFLNSNQNISSSELLNLHPAGNFREMVDAPSTEPLYLDSIDIKYNLTRDEKTLLDKHGFVVTERLSKNSFGQQLTDIYNKDLPVFISTDAILHAFHSSYDNILKDIELGILIGRIKTLITDMHSELSLLDAAYSDNENMKQMLMDVDVYLTVPGKLLGTNIETYYQENSEYVSQLLGYIEAQGVKEIPFFSSVPRIIDFSQFKPRGHYVNEFLPQLADYFKAMIWFGKMELYLIAPDGSENKPTFADVQRQTIDALLIAELIENESIKTNYEEIEKTISSFVGEQDNVTLSNLNLLIEEMQLSSSGELLDSLKLVEFQNTLAERSFAFQRILSQILINDPNDPDDIKPASAFMLFGQRFVIDSYVTGNVVYDKIKFNGETIKRMLPSTLDILYSLGNNAAAQLLKPELDEYHYSTNIAALRYLVDSYDDDFWKSSIYNSWLNSIRALNPPEYKNDLPPFMQTAAWWQQKMNTQLAGWTELRHDNLLYAKQSYTGGVGCFFPYSYVEPIPEFYNKIKVLAENSIDKINSVAFTDEQSKESVVNYFQRFINAADTLYSIAQKELNGTTFSDKEINFLKNLMSYEPVCGGVYNGWYPQLYYISQYSPEEEGIDKKDFLVADYHTAPTDEYGAMVGWVAHAGTGPVDMAIITADLPDGKTVSFIGPLMSYYEYTTNGFTRLTDNEWKETWLSQSLRPDWTNIYLADESGEIKTSGAMLVTGIEDENDNEDVLPTSHILAQNYPNPFNNGTIITFIIPQKLSNSFVELSIYNIQGRVIKKLIEENLPGGNYMTRWEGENELNGKVASGVYFYEVKVGNERFVGKMNLLK